MNKLIQLAKEASLKAYTPYSNFKVGCALEMKDGSVVQGCNIENASYGATNCAERVALASAYMQGYRKEDIVSVTVFNDSEMIISPCGICRQVLKELAPSTAIVTMVNGAYQTQTSTVDELLPFGFGKEYLNV